MAILCMRNEKKYAIWPLLVAESSMNSAMGQIPCSTERILVVLMNCFVMYFAGITLVGELL